MKDANSSAVEPCRAPDSVRGRRVVAVILLIVALVALATPHVPFHWRQGMLLVMGLGFVGWAALARNQGLVVPGGILTGMGVGVLLRPMYGNAVFLLCMAGGFALISVFMLAIFRRRVGWPFWPAAGLAFAGVMSLAGPDARMWFRTIGPYWPYLLIAVAVWLFFSRPGSKD